jgi:hypothetical protein
MLRFVVIRGKRFVNKFWRHTLCEQKLIFEVLRKHIIVDQRRGLCNLRWSWNQYDYDSFGPMT